MVFDPKIGINIDSNTYFVTFNIYGKRAKLQLANIIYVLGVAVFLFSAVLLSGTIEAIGLVMGIIIVLAAYEIFGKKKTKKY
jgi:hypothetical protein